jgi:hypothetical protein
MGLSAMSVTLLNSRPRTSLYGKGGKYTRDPSARCLSFPFSNIKLFKSA